MSELENQLVTDLGGDSANTEPQSETLEAQDTQSEAESVETKESDVDVANEIEARKEASRLATLQGQIKSYQSKLDSGKITIDQVPSYLQKHLKYEVEETEEKDDIDSLVEKKLEQRLAKEKDERVYQDKLQEIRNANVSKDDKQLLIQKWEQYKSKGFLNGEALAEAMAFVGVKPTSRVSGSSQGATLPKSSHKVNDNIYKMSVVTKLPQSQYNEIMKKVKSGEATLVED